MKYLVILHADYNDETASKKAIYELESEREAIALYHSTMSTYMNATNIKSCMVIVSNTVAGILVTDSYVA